MNKNKKTITVGIPAYNESANIKRLIEAILQQNERNYVLENIIVIVDGVADGTAEIIQSIKDKKLRLVINNKRMGQVHAQNLIFKSALSDVVILLEADTLPSTNDYLALMIDPIIGNSKVGMVQGNAIVLPSDKFIGKVIKAQIETYRKTVSILFKAQQNIYCISGRGGRAFTKSVYKQLVWPSSVPEDSYAFFWCHVNNISTVFQEQAHCLFKGPQTTRDLLFERIKTATGIKEIKKYFTPKELKVLHRRPFRVNAAMSLIFLIRHPFYGISYVLIKLEELISTKNNNFTDYWPVVTSTKNINLKI